MKEFPFNIIKLSTTPNPQAGKKPLPKSKKKSIAPLQKAEYRFGRIYIIVKVVKKVKSQ